MNKIYPILLIIIATIISFVSAQTVSMFPGSPAVYAQIFLLIFAIIILIYLLNNNLNKWILIVFAGIHILIALMQGMFVPLFSVIEVLMYGALIGIAKKVSN